MQDQQIALNRFGLGSKAGSPTPAEPRRWLLDQFDRYVAAPPQVAGLQNSRQMIAALAEVRDAKQERKQDRKEEAAQPAGMMDGAAPMAARPANTDAQLGKPLREAYAQAVGARNQVALATETPFLERMVAFWSNHFAVSIDKQATVGLAGAFENEAIRPHVLGKFSDMLFAVERHPGMLLYLDQAQSIGPGSQLAERVKARGAPRQVGLNENLAREILELHTLGVRTGYTQADVTEFARALTGWTVTGLGRLARLLPDEPGHFAFVPQMHEPGSRTVLGKKYSEGEEKQGLLILADLAGNPATARHIATKLARHFVADDPPPALVTRLEQTYLKTGGDLPSLYRTLVEAPEPWATVAPKFRPPWDWLVAVQRASGVAMPTQAVVFALNQLGQQTWRPGSPAGFDDKAASWAAPDALLRRVEFANRYARSVPAVDARALAPQLFPQGVSEATTQAIARAGDPAQALALLLVSPEMLRR